MQWHDPKRLSRLIRRLFDRDQPATFAGLRRENLPSGTPPSPELLLPADRAAAFVAAVDATVNRDAVDRDAAERDAPNRPVSDMESVVAQAMATLEQGYACYDRRMPPLSGEFDWSGRTRGGHRLYALRPHRFGFLPLSVLALARRPALAARLDAVLAGWQRHGAEAGRLAYFSNLLVLQRLLACLLGRAILAGLPAAADAGRASIDRRLAEIVQVDARFLRPRLGAAFANNHLLADRFAGWLLDAAAHGPGHAAAACAAQAFEAELLAQTLEDGCSFEHSTHYHELVSELAVLYLAVQLRAGAAVAPAVRTRIARMVAFQAALAQLGPRLVDLGDCAEDPILPVNLTPAETKQAFAAVAGRPVGRRCGAGVKAQLLAALGAEGFPPAAVDAGGGPGAFDSGGYLFLPAVDGVTLFRTGPAPGTQLAPGHMHSGFLSLYRRVGDGLLLATPGTYSYQGADDGWRAYFAGRRCRSALVIDDWEPLAPIAPNFRRKDSGHRVVTEHAQDAGVRACQGTIVAADGTALMSRGLIQLGAGVELVYDLIHVPELSGRRDQVWQFGADVRVAVHPEGPGVRAEIAGRAFDVLAAVAPETVRLHRGESDPPRGWVSPAYGEKLPATQAVLGYPPACVWIATAIAPAPAQASVQPPAQAPGVGSQRAAVAWQTCAYRPDIQQLTLRLRCGQAVQRLRLDCAPGGFVLAYTGKAGRRPRS